jgi:DNA-binding response OmpR family regulator
MQRTRILLVEDEPITRMLIEKRLRDAGHVVQSVPSGEAALELLATRAFALLLTDLHLDTVSGVELMAHARLLDPDLALVMLTSGASLETVVAGFHSGASHCLRKPVAPGELEDVVRTTLARRRQACERAATLQQLGAALLQQIAEPARPLYTSLIYPEPSIRLGELEIEPACRRVRLAGAQLPLSIGEYELLLRFARRPNTVLSCAELARDMFDFDCTPEEARDLIKTRVHRLRQKIECDPSQPTRLLNVRGAGYLLSFEDDRR